MNLLREEEGLKECDKTKIEQDEIPKILEELFDFMEEDFDAATRVLIMKENNLEPN